MNKNTASKFLRKNSVQMVRYKIGQIILPPSFLKRWKEATRVLLKD